MYSEQVAVSDGTMTFIDVSIDYIDRSEISVKFNDVLTTAWIWAVSPDKRILFMSAVPNGTTVKVQRDTDISDMRHVFSRGAAFLNTTMDDDFEQLLHAIQELRERGGTGGGGGSGIQDGQNLGGGSYQIFKQKAGTTLQFRTLAAGSNVSLSMLNDVLTISATGGGSGGPPTGAAGGVLSGTYPNPGFAVDMATQAELDAGLNNKANLNGTNATGSWPISITGQAATVPLAGLGGGGAADGDTLFYNATLGRYIPGAPTGGTGSKPIRIVIAGDSLTAQNSLLAPAWPQLLEEFLRASGANVEVFNVAINGWTFFKANSTTSFGTRTMRDEIVFLKPDIVITAMGFNDMQYPAAERPLNTVIADATSYFSALRAALPSAKLFYASVLPYDNVHASNPGTTLLNRQVMPCFFVVRGSGIIANTYCEEILGDSVGSDVRTYTTNWISLDLAIKGLGTVDAWYTMPLWKAARLGLCGYDMLHPTAEGSVFFASAAREAFSTVPVMQAALPNLSDQSYLPFNSLDTVFANLVTSSGGQYITVTPPSRNTNHTVAQWGPWRSCLPDTWYLPSKGSWQSNNNLYVQGNQYLWRLCGAPPSTAIEASVDGGAFGTIGASTDGRGDYVAVGQITLSPGTHVVRYKVGNEVYGPITQTIIASSLPVPQNVFDSAVGALAIQMESKADVNDVAAAVSTVFTPKVASGTGLVSTPLGYSANTKTRLRYGTANISNSDPTRISLSSDATSFYIGITPPAGKKWYVRFTFSALVTASTGTNNAHSIGLDALQPGGAFLYGIQLDMRYSPVANYATVMHGVFVGAVDISTVFTPWVWFLATASISDSASNGYGTYWSVEIIAEA